SNYPLSKQFYVEILGLEIIRETFREARHSYKLDLKINETTQIELFSFPENVPRAGYPEACGLRHLAFSVPDIEACVGYLQSQAVLVEPIRIDPLTGKRYTFFKDPDGLPLELYEG
ncbi:MAG: VOC family protein, partial [Candidatus Melainabacteria bacterium]|nr:VOC family protein [Candidatus Melainabacteria bacterium]